MSVPTGLRASVSRPKPARRQASRAGQSLARRRPFFEALEERRVLAVTWAVQSDYFGTRDGVSQPRSLRGLALSSDDQHVYEGFIGGTNTTAIREVSSGINASLIGNGTSSANTFGTNPVFNTGVEAFASPVLQPKGVATDDRGYVYATISATSNATSQTWGIYAANLGAQVSTRGSSNATASQLGGLAAAKLGGNYYAYIGWRNGLIERWNVNDAANPVLDTAWGAAGTPGKISLKTINANAYLNGFEVDSDGTIFAAGGLQNTTSFGDALIKIPAAAAASGNLATATSVNVQGGANGSGGFAAMDVALFAGKAYVTEYLQTNSTIAVFYTLDLSSAGTITPPITTLAGPSGKVSAYNSDAVTDSGFSGIDISADGKIYVAEQLYNFVAAAGSYTPPGGTAITGTRIYFDRVLISTALDVDGPVASAVIATPNPVIVGAGNLITLTANLNDTSTSGSTMASAEYSVDGGGSWVPMSAVDGTFNQVSENVTATFTLGAAGLNVPGSYSILVRGTDTAGKTGVAASTTLDVNGIAPTIDSANSTTFTVGTFSTFTITTSGTPTASLSRTGALPAGVSFVDNGDGTATLSGTPSVGTGNAYPFTITASNAVLPDASQSFTLTVNEAPSITSANTTTFTVAAASTFTVTTGFDFPTATTLSKTGALPSGVTFVDNGDGTATLSGTPGAGTQGNYELTITASNGVSPAASQSFTLVVNPQPYDFGDAPASYGTLLPNGARHLATGLTLGATRDVEADGQPGAAANGDGADEDGVTLPTTLYARLGAKITVNASATGRLDAWIDYNRNNVFDATEQIASGINVIAGNNELLINVPAALSSGASYARFRLSSAGGLSPAGAAADGEVEDYAITLATFAPGSATVVVDPENAMQNVLVVQGTNYFYETISVQPTAGQPGKVTVSVSPGATVAGIDLTTFGRIVIFGEGGLDSITIGAAITKPSTIYGDAGFDTINGGGGADTIYGGPDYDSLSGNGGDDSFVNEGGADNINGGAGFDTIRKVGSGTFNLSNSALSVGSDYVSISGIENAQLIGGAAADTFTFSGWTGSTTLDGGGGSNTLSDSADANYVLAPSLLTRTIGATSSSIAFANIQNVNLTGGFGNNTFNLSAWTGTAVVNGGYFGTDTVILAGDVNYNLTDAILQRPSFGMVRLSGIENAVITGGGSANTFNITNWSNAATLNGEGGNDKVVAAGNVNFTLSDTSLTRSTGGAITLSSIQEAEILGGAGNNVINGAAFTGTIKFDGAGGNDTLTSGSGPAILLGGAGNDTLTAGSGRAFMIGGLGLDRITGGSNSDLIIDGRTTSDDNAAALAHILADWISAQTYDQRADHVIADHLGTTNVIHDDSIDILLGGGDDDLFFAKLDAPFLDSIGDKVGIERAI